jgi:hypothetical protein
MVFIVATIIQSAFSSGFQRSSQGVPPCCSPPAKIRYPQPPNPGQLRCNVSEKANAASFSNACPAYWPYGRLAKGKQLCLTSAACRRAPLAGNGSHRPFRRHHDACASLANASARTLLCLPAHVAPDERLSAGPPHSSMASLTVEGFSGV